MLSLEETTKLERFLTLSQPQNASVSVLGFLKTEMTDFPTLSHTSTSKIPTLNVHLPEP